MAGNSADRFGGTVLAAGGVLFSIAAITHPDVSTIENAKAAAGMAWIVGHWAYLLGDVLIIAGLILLARRLEAGAGGGWGAVALAGGATGFALDAATTGMHLVSFPPAMAADAANLQAVFDTTTAVNAGMGSAFWFSACFGLAALGIALRKEAWAGLAAIVAMAVGALELFLFAFGGLTGSALIPPGVGVLIANLLVPLAYAFVGVTFSRAAA